MFQTFLVLLVSSIGLLIAANMNATYQLEEALTEFDSKRIIPGCYEAVYEFTEDFKHYIMNSTITTAQNSSDIAEKTNEIRLMEWSCSNTSQFFNTYDNRTVDFCSHIYSKSFRDLRERALNRTKEEICNNYGENIAMYTETCNTDVLNLTFTQCIIAKSVSIQISGGCRQAYMYITRQKGNIQTIERDLQDKDRRKVCCALANITQCIEELYDDRCKPLSEKKRDELKKSASSKINKDKNSFRCKWTLKACDGSDSIKVYSFLFVTLIFVVFYQYNLMQ